MKNIFRFLFVLSFFLWPGRALPETPSYLAGTWTMTYVSYHSWDTNHTDPINHEHTITLLEDGTLIQDYSGIQETSSWRYEPNGLLYIRVISYASMTNSGGFDISATVNNYAKPTEFKGPLTQWRTNTIGTYEDGISTVTLYRPEVPATSVELYPEYCTMVVGSSGTIQAIISPQNVTNPVIWSFECAQEETVISLDQNGYMEALSPGTAIVTAKCGDLSAQCYVEVVAEDGGNSKASMYIYGDVNESPIWDPRYAVEMNEIQDGVFYAENVRLTSPQSYFAFFDTIDLPWDEVKVGQHRFGPVQDNVRFILNEQNVVTQNLYSENAWWLPKGTYSFTFDLNTMLATATGTPDEDPEPLGNVLYLIGIHGWDINSSDYILNEISPNVFEGIFETTDWFRSDSASEAFRFYSQLGDWDSNSIGPDDRGVVVFNNDLYKGKAVYDGRDSWYMNYPQVMESPIRMTVDLNTMNVEFAIGDMVYMEEASEVILDRTQVNMNIGESLTLSATVLPTNAIDKTVVWSSSNPRIVSVNGNGKLTANAEGTATITASCGQVSATCNVTVNPQMITDIFLSDEAITLLVNQSQTIYATISPANANNKVLKWESSNPDVATVDENGKVTGRGVGEAEITASATDGSGVSASCLVTVTSNTSSGLVTEIILSQETLTLTVNQSLTITATVSPANAVNKDLEWASSNPEVATVDENGKITAVAVGEAIITASAIDGSNVTAACKVTVENPNYDPIEVNTSEQNFVVKDGEEITMWVSTTGGDVAGWNYKWTLLGETAVLSTTNSLTVEALNPDIVPLTTVYTLLVENLSGETVNFSQMYNFSIEVWGEPVVPEDTSTEYNGIEVSATKIRQDNPLTVSIDEVAGGYENVWYYGWYLQEELIGTEPVITVPALIEQDNAAINEKVISTRQYLLNLTNYGPEGEVWYDIPLVSPPVSVYRRPNTPIQLLTKGNGTTGTLILMCDLPEATMASLGYKFVYAYTDSNGLDHVIQTTDQRYCHVDKAIFDDPSVKFWAYTIWSYDDGSVVSSGRRFLNGDADDEFDASVFAGSTKGQVEGDYVGIFTLNGQYMGSDASRLSPGIYIIHIVEGQEVTSKKFIKR